MLWEVGAYVSDRLKKAAWNGAEKCLLKFCVCDLKISQTRNLLKNRY